MATCANCGTSIVFGGVKDYGVRFCNEKCHANAYLIQIAAQIPQDVVDEHAKAIHEGNCPKCSDIGPVDVHVSHKIWSAVFLSSWNSTPQLCCRSCAVKSQLGSILYCAILGWWGFPWGLILTPINIFRNIFAVAFPPDPARPSEQLETMLRVRLAEQVAEESQTAE